MQLLRSDDRATFVTPGQSEALLAAVAARTANPRAGIFGPDSASWKINREAALFLGAGRAAILQLAHPWVATALEQHSSLLSDPIARFHSTFRIVFTMIFGTLDQALAAARHLYDLHTGIRGEMSEGVAGYAQGSRYEANEVAALRWVFATLVESAVLAYEVAMGPLGAEERDAYYDESKVLAGLFGIAEVDLPEHWKDFSAYCEEISRSESLGVSAAARRMAHGLLLGAGSWIHPPPWYRALTVSWLPERFRDEFALEFRGEDRQAAERARLRLPAYYRRLPSPLRFVGPWHEARARLEGRNPGAFAGWSNRFWIGERSLPFGSACAE
jgi:uncharacterized protein (DUF2236 family)